MNQLFEIARLCLGKGGLRKKVWLILPNESEELSAHSKDGVVAWASSVLKSSGLDISILSSVAFSSLLSKNILPDEEPALILYDPKDDTSALLLSGLYTLERPKLREVCDRSFGLHMSQPGTISGYTNLRHSGHQLQVIDCYEHDPLALLKYVYSQLLYFHYIHDDVTHSKAESNAVQIHLYLRDDFAYDSKLNIIKHIKKVDHLGPLSQFSLKDFSPDQQHLVIIGAKRLDASLLNTLKVFGLLSGQQRFYTRLVILEPLQEVELQLLNLLQGVSRVDVHCIATGLELGDIKLLNKEQEVHKKLIASLNVPTDYWLSQANSFVSVCFNEPAVDLSRVGFEWRLSAERATGESSHRLFLGIKFSFYDDESKEVNKSDLHSLIVRALVQHLEPSNEC